MGRNSMGHKGGVVGGDSKGRVVTFSVFVLVVLAVQKSTGVLLRGESRIIEMEDMARVLGLIRHSFA